MDFNTTVTNLSESQLDILFGDDKAPVIPQADDLKTGLEPIIDTNPNPNDSLIIENTSSDKIDIIDDVDKIFNNEPTNADDKPADDRKVVDEETTKVLKNTVNFLVDKGLWKDFDGREDFEFTDESYAELAQKQVEEKVNDLFSELVDSTGDYGKAIISHIKKGGNPDEIIDLFKEQKALQSFDVTSVENQKDIIEKYYTEVVGWSKAKTDKFLSTLEGEDGAFEQEAKDAQNKFDELYSEQIKQIQLEQQKQAEKAKQDRLEYINTLGKEIDKYEGLSEQDKKLIKTSALNYNKKLEDGTPVSEFYIKFQKMQQDPKEYIKLIHFVVDPEGYETKVSTKVKNKVVEKSWNFIKGNTAVTKSTDTQIDNKTTPKTSFSFKK